MSFVEENTAIAETLKIIEVLKENNYKCDVRMDECVAHDTLFSLPDIAKILGYSSRRCAIRNIILSEKHHVYVKTKGGMQMVNYITFEGLRQLLTNSRKIEAVNFAKCLGIDIKYTSYLCSETDTIMRIMQAFSNENMIRQYKVKKFAIDLYFTDYKLAIECDEDHYDKEKDSKREKEIIETLGCKFIRYKPYSKDFNIFSVISEIFYNIKNQVSKK